MAFTSGTVTPPWRRSTTDAHAGLQPCVKVESVEENNPTFSADALEFVPALQNTWNTWQQPACVQCAINLDDYTDDESSSDEEHEKDVGAGKIQIPAGGNVTHVEPLAEPSPVGDSSLGAWLPPWKRNPPAITEQSGDPLPETPYRAPWRQSSEDAHGKDADVNVGSSLEDPTEADITSEPEAEEGPKSPKAVALNTAPGSFSVADMCKWRAACNTERDPNVSYTCVSNAEEVTPWQRRKKASPEQQWRTLPSPEECLEVSGSSWAAQQRARRATGPTDDDAATLRKINSLLNKLTVDNFERLKQQIVDSGIRSVRHVEVIIQEVIEKAVTQHHFIDTYAELCVQLDEVLTESLKDLGLKLSFKRLLLNACQTSFEQALKPPAGLHLLQGEEKTEEEVKYKLRMLGNIRFVGALLARRLLASKVFLAILEELLSDPSTEALEAAAALLTSAGFAFDKPEWTHHESLVAIFAQLENFVHTPKACVPRVRFLLKDLLDLRARGWEAKAAKKVPEPICNKSCMEDGAGWEDGAGLVQEWYQ